MEVYRSDEARSEVDRGMRVAAHSRSRLAMAGAGLATGIVGLVLMYSMNAYLATLLAGGLYGHVTYRMMGFPPRLGRSLIVAFAGGFGFLVAFVMALQGAYFVLSLLFPEDRIRGLQWVATFPIGGLMGSSIFLAGLRVAGVRMTSRQVVGFLLMNVAGSLACLYLWYFGIPIWQMVTASVLGRARSSPEADRLGRETHEDDTAGPRDSSDLP